MKGTCKDYDPYQASITPTHSHHRSTYISLLSLDVCLANAFGSEDGDGLLRTGAVQTNGAAHRLRLSTAVRFHSQKGSVLLSAFLFAAQGPYV